MAGERQALTRRLTGRCRAPAYGLRAEAFGFLFYCGPLKLAETSFDQLKFWLNRTVKKEYESCNLQERTLLFRIGYH